MTNLSVPIAATIAVAWNSAAVPALAAIAGERASMRFLEFYSARSAAALASSPALCCQGNAYAMIWRGAPQGPGSHQTRQPELPGDRDHSLTADRRHAGKGRRDGESCLGAHDTALRSQAR
jgi:hypothetical protein